MAEDAHGGVVRQQRGELRGGEVGAVRDADLAGVDRAADTYAAAVVQRHPRGARTRGGEGVEQRPVGDGVGAVEHALGLAVRRGDGAGVEVVAADDDGRGDLALGDEPVEQLPGLVTLAVAQPADARGQALELDELTGGVEPAVQVLVLGEQFLERGVGDGDVLRVA